MDAFHDDDDEALNFKFQILFFVGVNQMEYWWEYWSTLKLLLKSS